MCDFSIGNRSYHIISLPQPLGFAQGDTRESMLYIPNNSYRDNMKYSNCNGCHCLNNRPSGLHETLNLLRAVLVFSGSRICRRTLKINLIILALRVYVPVMIFIVASSLVYNLNRVYAQAFELRRRGGGVAHISSCD